jgi:hypothetical protein
MQLTVLEAVLCGARYARRDQFASVFGKLATIRFFREKALFEILLMSARIRSFSREHRRSARSFQLARRAWWCDRRAADGALPCAPTQ